MAERPNIVFLYWDNFGWGELGCYGGGVLRGAPTPRIDGLAGAGASAAELQRRGAVHAEPIGAVDRSPCHPLGDGSGADRGRPGG